MKRRKAIRGQGMTEYIIIVVAIALVVLGAVKLFGERIFELFNTASTEIGGDAADEKTFDDF